MGKWFFLFVLPLHLMADQVSFSNLLEAADDLEFPWFTGPLLAPSAAVLSPGHYNIEPYVYAISNTAEYNNDWKPKELKTFWNNSQTTYIQIGLAKFLDLQMSPEFYYNYNHGVSKWGFADFPIGFDIQLYKWGTTLFNWAGAIKLSVRETIPCGKYKNLDPHRKGTDIGGMGSWQTAIGVVWGSLFYLGQGHFLDSRLAVQYTLPAPVAIKNLSAYRGGEGTDGTVYPGQNFQADLGLQFSLTQNWAFAIDFYGTWTTKTRFKGKTMKPVGFPNMIQYSLAPALEYNWSGNLGLIFGSWFTVAGKNSLKFASGIVALNYYH